MSCLNEEWTTSDMIRACEILWKTSETLCNVKVIDTNGELK